jgi:penicillin-binding protein 1A
VEHIRRELDARYGRELYEGGLRIYTTLDLDMQEAAERALHNQLDAIESGSYGPVFGSTTYQKYAEEARSSGDERGPYSQYLQGALVAMDVRTGAVLALVGGRDFADSKFNRATQSIRQPGSTFKPFVYAAAIRAGHPVTEMLDDSPLNPPVLQLDSSLWQPKDYDDTTLGFISMRRSLYESRNLSTIKLGMSLGEQTVIGEARRFGITTRIRPYPSIHIGSESVYPLEIISAYSAFATLGTRVSPQFIVRVEDRRGNILWQPAQQREQVMDPEHAWLMLDMMRDVVRRGTAYSAVWRAGFTYPSAGKTGTTDD